MKNILLALFLAVFSTACYANTQVPANLVTSSTSAFAYCLTISDTNVQQALNDIDACFSHTTGSVWGGITGTLSNQTDLQSALNAKLNSTAQAADSNKLNGQLASYYQTALGFTPVSTSGTYLNPSWLTGVPYSILTGTVPTWNQSTTGTASNLSGTPSLPNGTTATTQIVGDNTTKIATDAFVLANAGGSGSVTTTPPLYGSSTIGINYDNASLIAPSNILKVNWPNMTMVNATGVNWSDFITLSGNQTVVGNKWFNNNNTVMGNGAGAATVLDTLTVQTGATGGVTINSTPAAGQGGIDQYTQLMLPLNNSVADQSYNNFTATNNSVTFSNSSPALSGYYYGVFNGSSSTVSVPDNAVLRLGTSDFTIDFWVKFTNGSSSSGGLFEKYISANTAVYGTYYQPAGKIYFNALTGSVDKGEYNFSFTPTAGTWYHLAFVRSGTNFYVFVNGVSQSLTTITAISNNNIDALATPVILGHDDVDGYYLNGGIQEFRYSVGTARWTSNFTPPTSPYTASTGKSTLSLDVSGSAITTISGDSTLNTTSMTSNGLTFLTVANTGVVSLPYGVPTLGIGITSWTVPTGALLRVNGGVALGDVTPTYSRGIFEALTLNTAQNTQLGATFENTSTGTGAASSIFMWDGTVHNGGWMLYLNPSATFLNVASINGNTWVIGSESGTTGGTMLYCNGNNPISFNINGVLAGQFQATTGNLFMGVTSTSLSGTHNLETSGTIKADSTLISAHTINSGSCASIGPVGKCFTSTGQEGYCSGALNACTTCTAC